MHAIIDFVMTTLISITALLCLGLAYSFYHEVIKMDAACGSIMGTLSDPPKYCDGRPFPKPQRRLSGSPDHHGER